MNHIFLYLQTCKKSDDSHVDVHVQNRSVFNTEYCNSFFPVNPVTGFPMSDTGKLMHPDLTPAEKERIMTRLQGIKGQYLPNDLTDKEIFDIIPPRYLSDDAVDVQRWRDYISREIMPDIKDIDNVSDNGTIDNNNTDNNSNDTND